eukprot:243706-Pyramimonas_sp.AAC.1
MPSEAAEPMVDPWGGGNSGRSERNSRSPPQSGVRRGVLAIFAVPLLGVHNLPATNKASALQCQPLPRPL